MPKLYLEKTVDLAEGKKLYFISYLRRDFVERSAVITLDGTGRVAHLYLSSYRHGSVEWENGSGLSESRVWETEDQAQEPTYLTRRYTSRLSNGEAGTGYTMETIVPDVLDNMADEEVASILNNIITRNMSDVDAGFSRISFKKRAPGEERRVDDIPVSIPADLLADRGGAECPERAPRRNPLKGLASGITGGAGMIQDALKKILPPRESRTTEDGKRQAGKTGVNAGHDKSVRERAEEGRKAARRLGGKKKR